MALAQNHANVNIRVSASLQFEAHQKQEKHSANPFQSIPILWHASLQNNATQLHGLERKAPIFTLWFNLLCCHLEK